MIGELALIVAAFFVGGIVSAVVVGAFAAGDQCDLEEARREVLSLRSRLAERERDAA